MLLGRFDENDERFSFEKSVITGNLTLTAKWAPFEDITYTGMYDDAIVSYTLMDRNLGATTIDIDEPGSEGYFFQR